MKKLFITALCFSSLSVFAGSGHGDDKKGDPVKQESDSTKFDASQNSWSIFNFFTLSPAKRDSVPFEEKIIEAYPNK